VRGNVSYGNYDAIRGKVVVNLPAFGPFSVKFAYLHDEIAGDYTNLLGGKTLNMSLRDPKFGTQTFAKKLGGRNIDGGQLAIRGEFGNLTADYRFDYTDSRTVGRAMQSLGVIPDQSGALLQPIVNLQPFFGGITNISPNARLKSVANATSAEHVVTQGHSLTLAVKPNDLVTLKSITAYRKFKQDPNVYDLAASGGLRFTFGQLGALITPGLTPAQIQAALFNPANIPGPNDAFFSLLTSRDTSQKQFSQEFQIQLDGENYELTAGAFYFHERSPATDVLGILSPTPNGVVVPSPLDAVFGSGLTDTLSINDSIAGYGQLTIHLGDRVDVTGGLRYTIDDRKLNINAISNAQGGALGVGKYSVSFNKLNYTGIVTWRPTDDSTVYGKISSGYVAGGILSGIPYKPETLVAYELGAKTQMFDNRLRLNVAAFYSDYKDLQTQNFINGRQFFDNAGKAKIKGFEVEADVVPVRGLVLSGNIGYADLNYKTFILNGVDVANVARTTYNSKWTARASAQYDAPEFSNGSHLQARVEGRYRSSYYLTSTPFRNLTGQVVLENENKQPGYWLVDGRVGLMNVPVGNSSFSVSAFGQNLLDKQYISFGAPVLSLVGTYDRGRTYGVELGFAF
jgi:iron complex outermembrane receptor protein